MHSLSAQGIIRIWETSQYQHPLDKALTILVVGKPEMNWDQLAKLPIGQRDQLLLDIREKTFGPTLSGFAECSKCKEPLEFTTSINELSNTQKSKNNKKEDSWELVVDKMKLKFRLPNSIDIAKAVDKVDKNEVKAAQHLIAQRCILETISNGKHVDVNKLPEMVINKLAKLMARYDPQAEIIFDLQCIACGHIWQIIFDIVTFLWKEISTYAKLLLQEVHTLAFAYKWREEDILSMTNARRQYYLGLLV